MVKYPDVLAKVQMELDSVLGRYQLPAFDDQESLPYLMATVKEVLRWKNARHPIMPPLQTLDSNPCCFTGSSDGGATLVDRG